METVGIFLKKEREANNLSLLELAQITKITPIYLKHIEKNEFDKIPQGPYIKGYLSSYSMAVGCDVDKIINLYKSANIEPTQDEVVEPETASHNTGEKPAEKPETNRPKQSSRFQLGNLSSRVNVLVSSVVTKGVSTKAATKTIGASFSSKLDNRKSFRHRKRTQAEVMEPETASSNTETKSPDTSKTIIPKRSSRLRLDRLSSRFKILASSVATTVVSTKAAIKTIGTTISSKLTIKKPFRHRVGHDDPSRISATLNRWLSDRRIWMYTGVGLCGAFILFLAGTGFYHLFLYTPESASVIETETTRNKEESLLSSADRRPSILPSSSANAATDTKKDPFASSRLAESARPGTAVSGAKPEAASSSKLTGAAKPNGESSSGRALKTPQASVFRDNTYVESKNSSSQQSFKSNPPPKPTNVDASLKVSKAAVCRAIENRMPAGIDRSFPISDGKIYVWTRIEAKQVPSKVRHIYYFGGEKISDVSLDVRSSNWRTWSSKTIDNTRYRGEWRVDIATSKGDVLRRLYYEVK